MSNIGGSWRCGLHDFGFCCHPKVAPLGKCVGYLKPGCPLAEFEKGDLVECLEDVNMAVSGYWLRRGSLAKVKKVDGDFLYVSGLDFGVNKSFFKLVRKGDHMGIHYPDQQEQLTREDEALEQAQKVQKLNKAFDANELATKAADGLSVTLSSGEAVEVSRQLRKSQECIARVIRILYGAIDRE